MHLTKNYTYFWLSGLPTVGKPGQHEHKTETRIEIDEKTAVSGLPKVGKLGQHEPLKRQESHLKKNGKIIWVSGLPKVGKPGQHEN